MPGVQPPSVDGILGLRGVLEQSDEEFSAEDAQALEVELLGGLDQLLDQLAEGRDAEGARMGGVLHDQLAVIESLSEEAGNLAAMQPEAIRQRLADQVAQLVDDVDALDPDRLAQTAPDRVFFGQQITCSRNMGTEPIQFFTQDRQMAVELAEHQGFVLVLQQFADRFGKHR